MKLSSSPVVIRFFYLTEVLRVPQSLTTTSDNVAQCLSDLSANSPGLKWDSSVVLSCAAENMEKQPSDFWESLLLHILLPNFWHSSLFCLHLFSIRMRMFIRQNFKRDGINIWEWFASNSKLKCLKSQSRLKAIFNICSGEPEECKSQLRVIPRAWDFEISEMTSELLLNSSQ